jgi:ubiquinone/menaquinone biosynthesis C-methylase UbiE
LASRVVSALRRPLRQKKADPAAKPYRTRLSLCLAPMPLLGSIYDLQLPLERPALRVALDLADPAPGERLLDVATGTAGLLRELLPRELRPAQVAGIDRSSSMLAVAPALPDGWRLLVADARRLPFADGHFDVVTVGYLLHLLAPAERGVVLREVARVLRVGGRVVTVTVDARRRGTRRLLERLPRASGLRPLEPSNELAAAALQPLRARFVTTGWPSHCVLARRGRA